MHGTRDASSKQNAAHLMIAAGRLAYIETLPSRRVAGELSMECQVTEDEQAIRKVVETWVRASQSGDAATVLSLMTKDAVFTIPGREPFRPQDLRGCGWGNERAQDEMRSSRFRWEPPASPNATVPALAARNVALPSPGAAADGTNQRLIVPRSTSNRIRPRRAQQGQPRRDRPRMVSASPCRGWTSTRPRAPRHKAGSGLKGATLHPSWTGSAGRSTSR